MRRWHFRTVILPFVQPKQAAVWLLFLIGWGPTWPVCPLCTCVPRGVGVSAAAKRLAAKESRSPPWSHPRRTPVRSPDSNSTFRKSMCCYLDDKDRERKRRKWVPIKKKKSFHKLERCPYSHDTDLWLSSSKPKKKRESTKSDLHVSGTLISKQSQDGGFPADSATLLLR